MKSRSKCNSREDEALIDGVLAPIESAAGIVNRDSSHEALDRKREPTHTTMSAITPGERMGKNTRDPRGIYESCFHSYHHEVMPCLELLLLLPYLT